MASILQNTSSDFSKGKGQISRAASMNSFAALVDAARIAGEDIRRGDWRRIRDSAGVSPVAGRTNVERSCDLLRSSPGFRRGRPSKHAAATAQAWILAMGWTGTGLGPDRVIDVSVQVDGDADWSGVLGAHIRNLTWTIWPVMMASAISAAVALIGSRSCWLRVSSGIRLRLRPDRPPLGAASLAGAVLRRSGRVHQLGGGFLAGFASSSSRHVVPAPPLLTACGVCNSRVSIRRRSRLASPRSGRPQPSSAVKTFRLHGARLLGILAGAFFGFGRSGSALQHPPSPLCSAAVKQTAIVAERLSLLCRGNRLEFPPITTDEHILNVAQKVAHLGSASRPASGGSD